MPGQDRDRQAWRLRRSVGADTKTARRLFKSFGDWRCSENDHGFQPRLFRLTSGDTTMTNRDKKKKQDAAQVDYQPTAREKVVIDKYLARSEATSSARIKISDTDGAA